MEPIYKNVTKYSKDIYMKFIEFHNKKYGLKYQIYTILFIILLIYCIIINIQYKQIGSTIIFSAILALVVYYRYFSQIKIIKKELKSKKIEKEDTFYFYFYEKYFKVREKSETYKVKYKELYKVHETDEFFYLYIDRTHSYILEKDKFTKGNPNEFYKFIKSKKFLL